MRYEQEILEKIMYYDPTGTMSIFPLYIYKTREKVNRQALETAVGYAIECHPLFGCRLAEDEKGSYLETNPEKPVIPDLSPDREYFYGNESNHCYPWVIGIRDREIIYTCFHGFADGIGSTIFMRTVLYYYFREQGIDCAPGKAVTLEQITPEYLEKDTELSVKKNGTKDVPSLYEARKQNPTVFPDELLEEESDHADVHNLAISLADIRKKSAEYEVSQFAVMTTYIAQAICSVLPGTDNVVVMNIVTDMRGLLNSATTHNCVMVVPVTFAQKDLQNKSDELLCWIWALMRTRFCITVSILSRWNSVSAGIRDFWRVLLHTLRKRPDLKARLHQSGIHILRIPVFRMICSGCWRMSISAIRDLKRRANWQFLPWLRFQPTRSLI